MSSGGLRLLSVATPISSEPPATSHSTMTMESQKQEPVTQPQALEIEALMAKAAPVREDVPKHDSLRLDAKHELPPAESLKPLSLAEVELILNYEFEDKNLLEEALTHSSFFNEDQNNFSYERLEYVGDAVLNLLITKEQYFLYPSYAPGRLTRLRAANVDTEKLARVAITHGLHRYLRHKKPLLEEQIREFKKGMSEYPLHSNGLIDVPKALADIVESLVGAVFIDSHSSIDTVWKVFKDLLEPKIDPETIKTHPVTELYEVCQKNHLKIKFIDTWKESAAVDVFIDDKPLGRGTYGLKKEIAQNRAAKNALDNMATILGPRFNANNEAVI